MTRFGPRWLVLGALAASASAVVAGQAPATTSAGYELVRDGFSRLDEGRFDDGKALFEKALAVARDERNPRLEAQALRGLGRYWGHKNEPAAATDALDRSLKIFDALGDDAGSGQVWNQRATNAYFRQQWTEAETGYRNALAAFARAGLPGEEANALRNLTFLPTVSLEDRLQLIATAVDRAVAGSDRQTQALALHNWGDLLTQTADYAGGMKKLEEARSILEQLEAPAALSRVYTSLGRAYRLHGEGDLALPYYERALTLQQRVRDVAGEIQTLNARAIANHSLNRPAPARVLFDRALTLAQARGTPAQVSLIRRQLGIFLIETGHPAEGATLLEQSIGPELGVADRVPALTRLSAAYLRTKRYREAESAASEAIALAANSPNLDARRAAHFARASVARAAGRLEEAAADIREVLDLIERTRPNLIRADALRLGFGERMRSFFDFAISLFVETGRMDDVFLATEQGRSRAFLDLLASQNISTTIGPPSLEALRQTASRLGSTVLSYWVTPQQTVAVVLDREGVVHARAIAVTAARLDALVSATAIDFSSVAAGLTTRGPQSGAPDRLVLNDRGASASRDLYDLLIRPVRQWLPVAGDSLLTIVPDGALNRLSFSALRNERDRYLLEGYRIHYTSALSVLEVTGRPAVDQRADRMLIVANPALAAGSRAGGLPALPGALREAAALSGTSTGSVVEILSGREATETRVRAEAAGRSVLHFAAHSVVRDDRPLDSFLALARGTAAPLDDGVLTAREIYGLKLSASLVVLSACRSGGGKVTGDGIVGLTRAFMAAGVPSVVASIWDLPDETAPWLFERFYAARTRMTAVAALRRAQLDLLDALRRGAFRVETAAGTFVVPEHPAVWAGLQLWGQS